VSDRPTPADRLRAKKPRQITVGVFLDEAPADRLEAAIVRRAEAVAQHADPAYVAVIDQAISDARAALDEVTIWLTFRAIGRSAFGRLLAEHPASQDDIGAAQLAGREMPEYSMTTFAPALIHASLVAPALEVADVEALYEDGSGWNEQELGALFAAALAVNTRARPLQVRADE
jgi:hypothetical protein